MKINAKLILLSIAVIISFSHSAFASTPISCGQVIADSINVAGEQDSYTFDAQANDSVTIRAAKTSGGLYPYLELYAPGGAKIANAASVIDKVLTIAGTYTIIVKDQYGSYIGDYCVTWQRLNNPCSPVINCGQNINGTIGTIVSQPPWLFYYFDAQVNDKITIRSTKTSGDLYAYLELYAPDGTNLVKASGKIDKTLTAAGKYTIVVRDQYSSYTGDFCLIWMRLNNPCSTALNCNQAAAGSITTNERFKFYSFSAQANDSVSIRNIKTSGGLYAYLELYSPDGTNLGSAANVIDRTLPVTGIYTIIARDQYNNYLGDFIVLWQKINNPCDLTALACGQTLTGTIGSTTSQPPWRFFYFDATAGDKITIRAAKTSDSLYPYTELYAPDGTNLGGAGGQLDKSLTATGRYLVLIRDQYNSYTGNFAITWQKLTNPCNAVNIAFGQSTSGNIDSYSKLIAYKFTASANDKIYIAFAKLTETAGYFNPVLELYDSSGAKITSTTSSGTFTAAIPATGEYSLFVADTSRDGAGTYEITLQRSNNPAEVTSLDYNTLTENTLQEASGINVYSFTANTSDIVTICSSVKTTTSGYFGTYLELFNSSGIRLTNSSSNLKYTFSAGGTFYLFITDQGRDGTGTYRIKLLSGDFTCASIDFVEPQVTLANPVGGEVIESGSTYTINWASSDNVGITSQEIRLSTDGGVTYPTVIASGLASTVQNFNWEVPLDLGTNQGRIKITCLDAASNEGHDESDTNFSVIITNTLPPDIENIGYEYDKLNRLTRSISDTGVDNNYTYDALGNRLSLDVVGTQSWILILPVPWYQEEHDYYSAAASCKMTLDYIRQDTSLTQDELYNYVAAGQTRELNPLDVRNILQHFKPTPYNFTILAKTSITDSMRDIAHWMDYEVPNTAIPNCSVVIPTYGTYDNWMAVRGASASEDPNANINLWNTAEFTVYGFWLNDPATSGIGENSYKTAAELESTYYLPLTTGDTYAGKFIAVAEPPKNLSRARTRIAERFHNRFHRDLGDIVNSDNEVSNDSEEEERALLFPTRYKRFDWKKIIDPHLSKDKNFEAATKDAVARRPLKVKMLNDQTKFYYLLPLDKARDREALTSAVLILEGSDFSFKEASWVKTPVKFPKISKREAIALVKKTLLRSRSLTNKRRVPDKIKADLVWQQGIISSSPYRPFWRVTVGSKTWLVTEEGKIIPAEAIK